MLRLCFILTVKSKNMKFQQLIEKLHINCTSSLKHTPISLVIKTSQSIGTLNSHQDQTDRSFAIKDNLVNIAQYQGFAGQQAESNYDQEHLRFLCSSQRNNSESCLEKPYEENTLSSRKSLKESQVFKKSPVFYGLEKQTADYKLVKNGNKSMTHNLLSCNGIYENQDENQSQSLYQEAPSHIPPLPYAQTQPNYFEASLDFYYQSFNEDYEVLLKKAKRIEDYNLKLEQKCLQEQRKGIQLRKVTSQLQRQIIQLKQQFKQSIEENIKIQNLLKEILLRHQIQKFRGFNCNKKPNEKKNKETQIENKKTQNIYF